MAGDGIRLSIAPPREVYGFRASAEALPGLGPDVILGSGEVEIRCYPNGTCDAATLYLQDADKPADATNNRLRIVMMPLNGAPLVFADW